MWENEAELKEFIKQKLEENGHSVRSEVRIQRFRIDLIAEKEEPITSGIATFPRPTKIMVRAIEVKLDNRGKIYDVISRCINLSYLPQIDEIYVAFPEMYFRKGIREYLKNIPVGAIVAKEQTIQIFPPSWNRQPPNLLGRRSYPTSVSPGEEF